MKKSLLISILLLLAVALAQQAEKPVEQPRRVIVSGEVNGHVIVPKIDLWSTPGGPFSGGKLMLQVDSGDSVDLLDIQDQIWCRVHHLKSDSVGYVSKNFIPVLVR